MQLLRTITAGVLLSAAAPALAQTAQPARPTVTATSPDGTLVLTVTTDNDARPHWSITRKGKLLIAPSKLGFIMADRIGLQRGFSITGE